MTGALAMPSSLTSMGAKVLSKRYLPGRTLLTGFVVVTMFVSGGLIPTYLNMRDLKLLNTIWALMIPGAISTWNMLLLRNFFMAIPAELSESARIDGCGEIRLLVQIILPLSLPILATLALFYGVGFWNQYSNVIIYNTRVSMQNIQVIIRNMYYDNAGNLSGDMMNFNADSTIGRPPMATIRAATVIFTTVPILCVYPFLQKYFAQGIMVGSLKG
jgi:putative aldouronate transport system permease protein